MVASHSWHKSGYGNPGRGKSTVLTVWAPYSHLSSGATPPPAIGGAPQSAEQLTESWRSRPARGGSAPSRYALIPVKSEQCSTAFRTGGVKLGELDIRDVTDGAIDTITRFGDGDSQPFGYLIRFLGAGALLGKP